MPEAIEAASDALGKEAIRYDNGVSDAFLRIVRLEVIRLLARLRLQVGEFAVDGRKYWTVCFSERSWLVVGVVSSLSSELTSDLLEDSYESLLAIGPQTTSQASEPEIPMPDDASVAHLLIVAVPRHIAVLGQGVIMPLEDLDWIDRVREDPDALFHFCQDLDTLPGVATLIAFETVNLFEHWWENARSLHRAGVRIDLLSTELHRGEGEWKKAERDTAFERALEALQLRPLSAWVHQDFGVGSVDLVDPYDGTFLRIQTEGRSLAVGGRFKDFDGPLAESIEFVSQGIAWKFARASFGDRHLSFSLRIRLVGDATDSSQEGALRVHGELLGEHLVEVVIGVSEAVLEVLHNDAEGFENLIGAALAVGIEIAIPGWRFRESFMSAWFAAPPGIRVDSFRLGQEVQHRSAPETPEIAIRSRALKRLGKLLASKRLPVGRLVGKEACSFETTVVFPELRSQLHEAMAQYSASGILQIGLTELERAHGYRSHRETRLAFWQRFPVHSAEPLSESGEIIDDSTRVTRATEMILEEALHRPPDGPVAPDRMEWRELLALADVLLESAVRSEKAHLDLEGVAVVINELYEVFLRWDGPESDFDMDGFSDARVRNAEIGPGRTDGEVSDDDVDRQTPVSIVAMFPHLQGIDRAMAGSLSFSLDTLFRIIAALRAWPVTQELPFVWADVDDVVAYLARAGAGTAVEIRAVLSFLTYVPEKRGLEIEHWEQERRPNMLASRPFIAAPTNLLAIAPWTLGAFLRRLVRYLEDGRLIWPDRALPEPVLKALRSYRQTRNDAFEAEVLQIVVSTGFHAIGRVKKARVLGLTVLPGEIDVIGIDESRNTIWVIEAKDPFEVFSLAQIRYSIDRFHDDSRRGSKYVAKLLKKVEVIRSGAASVASALGVPHPDRPWEVQPLMVTRQPVPAAYTRNTRVPFSVPSELANYLSSQHLNGELDETQ